MANFILMFGTIAKSVLFWKLMLKMVQFSQLYKIGPVFESEATVKVHFSIMLVESYFHF
jgi:hypothetical protein